ncbi:hypothetical protein V2J09_008866 [Rumex salicifolius]
MSLFSTPQQQQVSPFQFPNQQQQQQPQSLFSQQQQQFQQHQQQTQQFFLFTKDRAPAGYSTKWEDLHPDSQKVLLQIEEKVLEHRDESQRLDQCSRLFDSSISNDTFEMDAVHVVQKLGGISTSLERQKVVLQELMTMLKDMLRNTEVAVRSFMMLQPRFLHPKSGAVSNATVASQGPAAPSHPPVNSFGHVVDFYSGIPTKPSIFVQQTVSRFEKYLGECRQWIEELEQLISLSSEQNLSNSNSLLQSLPKLMSNVHDFFIHVAAKVESIHQYIESMRAAYLAHQRRRGEGSDPFLEADRRESARREAAAKRVHPTLHLPALPQPSTQAAGLFSSSVALTPSTAPQVSSAPAFALPSGSSFSLFGTSSSSAPSSAASAPSFNFATVAASTATASSLFAPSPQTPFPSIASSSTAPSSLFTGNAAASAAGGGNLFSTPFGTGAATGSGASFGTVSRSRPKPRTSRR